MSIQDKDGSADGAINSQQEKFSVIQPFGYSISKCGYCKGSRSTLLQSMERKTKPSENGSASSMSSSSLSSKSYSVLAESLSPSLYEELINRGWRRSGVHLYKPQNFSSCCPTLTTRLLTKKFQPTKSQRKVLKKMDKVLKLPFDNVKCAKAQMASFEIAASTSKRQKRNDREKQKSNYENTEARRMKSLQGSSNKVGLLEDEMKLSPCTSFANRVKETGILNRLENVTLKAVEKFMVSDTVPKDLKGIFKQQQKKCRWKTAYRILPASKREKSLSRVRVISTLCAQVTGYLSSMPLLKQISRESMVQDVVHLIKEDEEGMSPVNSNVSIISLDPHPQSGQIMCTLEIEGVYIEDNNNYEAGTAGGERRQAQGKDENVDLNFDVTPNIYEDDKEMKSECKNNSTGDKLGQWYEKSTGKKMNLGSNQRCITVDTLPAHESALKSEVHKLYTLYQHIVHGDHDPFSDDPNTSTIEMDADTDDDDEQKFETDDPSKLDWGHAPAYFKENVTSMLFAYFGSMQPAEKRSSLLSSYFSFYQFLVESPFPLPPRSGKENSSESIREHNHLSGYPSSRLPCGLYHQHYRLGNDLLIAVGVVDVLPTGLSSVYLFYDPSFSYDLVALGKYAILKEIEFARDTLKVPHYYLGYYIESCQKMRYKTEYQPSQLLCPVYYEWVDAEKAIAKIQNTTSHVCTLIDEIARKSNETDTSAFTSNDEDDNRNRQITRTNPLKTLQMDIGAAIHVTIDMLQPNGVEIVKPILEEFIAEFSPRLSRKCILKLY